jgi:peptide/nickel transport system permease protein
MTVLEQNAAAEAPVRRMPLRGRHPVLLFLARRLSAGLATLVVVAFLIFVATNALPGNVAQVILGHQATPHNVAVLDRELNLNHPFIVRFGNWFADAAHGDLGRSAIAVANGANNTSVASEVGQPLLNSTILAVITAILLVPLALLLGTIAAVNAGRAGDWGISFTVLILGAFPEFVLGTFLIAIFFSLFHLLPPAALVAPRQSPLDHPTALVLPVLTLLGVAVGFAARQVRAGVLEALHEDYVGMARLNGYGERRVLLRYALRNAMAPAVQAIAQTIQYLVGGIIVVETLFTYPGIGSLLDQAVSDRDITTVAGVSIILAAIYIVINIVADLIDVALVPKLRTSL